MPARRKIRWRWYNSPRPTASIRRASPYWPRTAEFYNERRDYASSLNYTRRLFASDEMPLDDKLAYFDRITGDRNFYSTFYLQINDLATTLAMKYPHDPRVVKLYGDHLIASGQLDDALTYYKTHLDDLPPRIDYFNMVIDIESYKQRPDSVEHYTSRAMKLFPENVDLHLRKGTDALLRQTLRRSADILQELAPPGTG